MFIGRSKAESLSAHAVTGGDVLVTKMGDPPGDVAIYPHTVPPAVITADCIKISVDPLVITSSYLRYALEAPNAQAQILEMTAGVAQRKVSLAKFRRLKIPVPPLPVQTQATELLNSHLSHLDAALAVADEVEELASALRRSLLHAAFTGKLTEKWRKAP